MHVQGAIFLVLQMVSAVVVMMFEKNNLRMYKIDIPELL